MTTWQLIALHQRTIKDLKFRTGSQTGPIGCIQSILHLQGWIRGVQHRLAQAELANFGLFALSRCRSSSFSLSLKITIPSCLVVQPLVFRLIAGLDFSLKVNRRIAGLDFSSRFQPAVSACSFSLQFQLAFSARSLSLPRIQPAALGPDFTPALLQGFQSAKGFRRPC